MRMKPALTAADAQKIMAACKAEAGKNNWAVAIAIVDDGGSLLLLERLDGAGPLTPAVAQGKARNAAFTKRPSKFFEDRIKDRPALARMPYGIPVQGGLPIIQQGDCIGAIGVSGVQSHEDEQVANAGLTVLG